MTVRTVVKTYVKWIAVPILVGALLSYPVLLWQGYSLVECWIIVNFGGSVILSVVAFAYIIFITRKIVLGNEF